MAVTAIWPIKGRVDKVIAYARNPEKTQEGSYNELSALHAIEGVVEYAADEIKTERRSYVSCVNLLSEESAAQEFIATKRQMGKLDGRTCYHGYQSFKAEEVTAEIAHTIGVKLAEELWGDRFEVVVATHCNTGHYHNHFVINSVSFVDGKKFYNSPADYARMRAVSDRLCREYGLSVIENAGSKTKSYAEWQAEKAGKPTQRSTIRADIDRAIKASVTREEFFAFLQDAGYELKLYTKSGNWLEYPALKPPGAKGFFRFHKLGPKYDLDAITKRILKNLSRKEPFPEVEEVKVKQYCQQQPPPLYERKKPRLYRLYLRYCYELHIIEKHPSSVQRVSFFMREDIAKLDKLDAQTRFLAKHQFSTAEALLAYKVEAAQKLTALADERAKLWNEVKRCKRQGDETAMAEAKGQIAEIRGKMKSLRKEVVLCDDILMRSAQTRDELEWLLDQQDDKSRKEETSHELLRGRSGTGREDELGRS